MYPSELKYSKEHEWIRVEEGVGTIGITQFAQDQLGDIVYVELPEKGKTVSKGDVIGTIESVKAVSEIFSPISGTIVETNESLDQAPEEVNHDPHGKGWYCKMQISDPAELEQLMDAAGYEEFAATAD